MGTLCLQVNFPAKSFFFPFLTSSADFPANLRETETIPSLPLPLVGFCFVHPFILDGEIPTSFPGHPSDVIIVTTLTGFWGPWLVSAWLQALKLF